MFTLHQKVCKSTKYWAHPPIQLRQTRHTKNMTLGETLISPCYIVLSVIQHCAHYTPQQRIDILWHSYSVSLQMQRHVPPPKRRDTHREPLEVPLNLPKAHHRYYWVCYNWNSTTTSWRWYVHRTLCSLVCASKEKTSVSILLHTQKNTYTPKNKKK
jgi:hypothetical protein